MLSTFVDLLIGILESLNLDHLVGRRKFRSDQQTRKKLVVVTGADSGFGLSLTLELARMSEYHVLATVLLPQSIEQLKVDFLEFKHRASQVLLNFVLI